MKNHKATKPAFNGGPDDGQLLEVHVFGSSLPLSTKKTLSELDPSNQTAGGFKNNIS